MAGLPAGLPFNVRNSLLRRLPSVEAIAVDVAGRSIRPGGQYLQLRSRPLGPIVRSRCRQTTRSSADSSREEGIMTPERPNEDLRTVWRTETSDTAHLSRAEIRRIVDEMERKMRRSRIDFIAAVVLVSVTIIAIAVLFPGPLLTVDAIVTVAGFSILTYEMFKQWRRAPIA